MHVIVLDFENFKSLTGQHRIYYYEGINFFDFHFLVDGQIVKSTVMKESIDNVERFFSEKMFYGAMRIKFNIPVPKEDSFSEVTEGIKIDIPVVPEVPQDTELINEDIQVDGVDE